MIRFSFYGFSAVHIKHWILPNVQKLKQTKIEIQFFSWHLHLHLHLCCSAWNIPKESWWMATQTDITSSEARTINSINVGVVSIFSFFVCVIYSIINVLLSAYLIASNSTNEHITITQFRVDDKQNRFCVINKLGPIKRTLIQEHIVLGLCNGSICTRGAVGDKQMIQLHTYLFMLMICNQMHLWILFWEPGTLTFSGISMNFIEMLSFALCLLLLFHRFCLL